MSRLVEGEDFYYNEEGYMVLTEKFHLQKGFCCGNSCKHCPYNYVNVPEPKRSTLLNSMETKKN
ncbi:MAG: DUF5522 domain-containing protein [Bacteroidota bacterium]